MDRIRDLGWPGVLGNTDELLFRPESIEELPPQIADSLAPVAAAAREALGEDRLAWLGSLPLTHVHGEMALVHASAVSPWRSPGFEATDEELQAAYAPLGKPLVVYAHIHRAFARKLPGLTVANTGSVSLSHHGDARPAYLVIDGGIPAIWRVNFDSAT